MSEFDAVAVFNRLLSAMPHPQVMSIVEMGAMELRFEWRGAVYRVSRDCFVEEVEGGMLTRNDCAILIGHILKNTISLVDARAEAEAERETP